MTHANNLHARNILLVFPRYVPSFGTFEHAYHLAGSKAFMPPQGLLTIAAYLPAHWHVRFFDENMGAASPGDFAWADAVFASGMHIQRREIAGICGRAHAAGKIAVLGGPSVSACPDYYPEFDVLHCGELGDATDALIALLGDSVARPARPARQLVLTTRTRRELSQFPMPAYELAHIDKYMLGSVQFSSGCPYKCEFCDIPGLYGRVPRLKTPERICAELDKLVQLGMAGVIYFVDDNFIGNRKAAKELLPHLVAWQKRNGYPVPLACEATLNIARSPDILAMMRDAGFDNVFCGIESPDSDALLQIDKSQNMVMPILDAVRIINDHGLSIVSGIILGFDSDTPDADDKLLRFIDASKIPMLTINMLQALPKTPLWDRLEKAGRIVDDAERESNVHFLLPYDDVVAMWRRSMSEAYRPEALFDRYRHQLAHVWPKRGKKPLSRQRLRLLPKGLTVLGRLIWHVGLLGEGGYRGTFWRFALPLLMRGQIEPLLHYGLMAHHLIVFAAQATAGKLNASHYSVNLRDEAPVAMEAAE